MFSKMMAITDAASVLQLVAMEASFTHDSRCY